MVDASDFVARVACPACAFPIGIREADRTKQRVRCPVCGAQVDVTVAAPASDGPFREGAELLSLVPSKRASLATAGKLFAIEGYSPHRRIARGASVLAGAMALLFASLGWSAAVTLLSPVLGFVILGYAIRRKETGRLVGGELQNVHETPWSRTDRITLAGATVRIERHRSRDGHVVVVEASRSRLVVGETVPLTAEQADEIAERVRDLADAAGD